MPYLALVAVLSMNVLTWSSAPASAWDTRVPVEQPFGAPRWVVFDFISGIKTVEFADGSLHEELFDPVPVAQMALSTVPYEEPQNAVVTGSVSPAPR
jgi:hypothetical protein